ncbi:MAG: MFS transporter [Chloroflexota bacterium]
MGPPSAAEAADSLWRNRPFLRLWLAQALSQTAGNAVNFGLIVMVERSSQSSLAMALAVLTVALPSVVLGVPAGALIDRGDARRIVFAANALRAVCVIGYPLFEDRLVMLLLTNLAFSVLTQFFAPAEAALIPALVRRGRLVGANSLFQATFVGSQAAGLAVLGPAMATIAGLDALFALVAALFGAAAALTWRLPSVSAVRTAERLTWALLVADARRLAEYLRSDRIVAVALPMWLAISVLLLVVAAVAPRYVVAVLALPVEASVALLAPAALGGVLASGVLARMGDGIAPGGFAWRGMVGVGLCLFALGAIPRFGGSSGESVLVLVLVLALAGGVLATLVVVPSQAAVQGQVPADLRGRVFATQFALANAASVLPLLGVGAAGDLLGPDVALLLLGAVVMTLGFAAARSAFARGSAALAAGAGPHS